MILIFAYCPTSTNAFVYGIHVNAKCIPPLCTEIKAMVVILHFSEENWMWLFLKKQ